MKIIYSLKLIFFLLSGPLLAQNDTIKITVHSNRSHQLRAIGFNENVGTFNEEEVRNAIRESKFNSLAYWGTSIFINKSGDFMWTADRIDNVDSLTMTTQMRDLTRWCVDEGLDHIELLATYDSLSINEVCNIYAKVARKIVDLNIPLTAVSTGNKINTGHGFTDSGTQRRHPDSVALCTKLMRKKLDEEDLSHIKVFGPSIVEWHPRLWDTGGDQYDFEDGDTALYLNALVEDSAALSALFAFDENSYGRSIGNWEYELSKNNNKEFWISLHATDSYNNNWWTDLVAPVSAGNLLSNLNHGASLWNYWVLRDLLGTYRFAYLSNISQHFDRKGWIHRCKSEYSELPNPWMRFNYNHKENGTITGDQPDIIAAAIENPDSSWSVGVVNLSGIKSQHKAVEFDQNLSLPYEIQIYIPALEDTGMVQFALHMTNATKTIQSGDTITMAGGKMNFTLDPKNLYVLRSARIVPDQETGVINLSKKTSEKVSVYPTVSSGRFTIITGNTYAGSARVKVYTITGKLVYDARHDAVGGDILINISDQAKGIYLVRTSIDHRTHKIIVK